MNLNDKFSIELDEEFLESLYELVYELPPNKETVTLEDMKRVIAQVKKNGITTAPKTNNFDSEYQETKYSKRALIVDDLGVITFQLSSLFSKHGYVAVTSQDIYDAIKKFKQQFFDVVIVDLFIPTQREGFLLLDEIVKINNENLTKATIGVMTASNKKEHKQTCLEHGANFYVEKVEDWQKHIIDLCNELNN